MRIGVDVGGTNTDAVLMDGRAVIATQKTPTTANVSDGIVNAITSVLVQSATPSEKIQCVMIGTTQFTNAFVERRNLVEVGIIRLSLPASRGISPLTDWPEDIRLRIRHHPYYGSGVFCLVRLIQDALWED